MKHILKLWESTSNLIKILIGIAALAFFLPKIFGAYNNYDDTKKESIIPNDEVVDSLSQGICPKKSQSFDSIFYDFQKIYLKDISFENLLEEEKREICSTVGLWITFSEEKRKVSLKVIEDSLKKFKE